MYGLSTLYHIHLIVSRTQYYPQYSSYWADTSCSRQASHHQDSIEERILNNRRSMAADRPNVSTQLDGTSDLMEEENTFDKKQASKKKRDRHEDEADR